MLIYNNQFYFFISVSAPLTPLTDKVNPLSKEDNFKLFKEEKEDKNTYFNSNPHSYNQDERYGSGEKRGRYRRRGNFSYSHSYNNDDEQLFSQVLNPDEEKGYRGRRNYYKYYDNKNYKYENYNEGYNEQVEEKKEPPRDPHQAVTLNIQNTGAKNLKELFGE